MNNTTKIPSVKNFGITFTVVFILLGIFLNYLFFIISSILLLITYLKPSYLKTPNILWFKFGIMISKVVSPIIMGIIFFGVVTPIGFVMKYIFFKNLLSLKKKDLNTHWVKKDEKINFEDQF